MGIFIFGTGKKSSSHYSKTGLFITLICFIVYAFAFETVGAVKASFILSFILGAMWNRNAAPGETFSFTTYLATNIRNIAENIFAACVCAAGIWLIFERIFGLMLP